MSRKYFEEVQSFRQTRWVWVILVPFSLLMILPLMDAVYWQLIKGKPWGDKPMSDGGLMLFFGVMMLTWGVTTWVLLSLKLEVYIDSEGLHYRFLPIKPGWTLIRKEDIVSFEICRKKNFFKTGGFGYHRNYFNNTRSMMITGFLHIRILLTGQHKLLIGTQHPEGFERAIRRLMSTSLNV